MIEFRVSWDIEVEAETHEEAARIALEIQRDPNSVATCFNVIAPCPQGDYHIEEAVLINLEDRPNVH